MIEIHKQWSSYGWVKPIKDKRMKDEIIKSLNLPLWKQDFIRKNRHLYSQNKLFIDEWLERWGVLDRNSEGELKIPVSRTKYEWQAGPDSRTNWENIFQFRPSGIRVKRGNYFPALYLIKLRLRHQNASRNYPDRHGHLLGRGQRHEHKQQHG